MKNQYEIISHTTIHSFKIFLVNLLYREPHVHGDIEICYILEGSVIMCSKGQKLCCKKNDFVIFNSCQPHEIYGDENNPALILALQVSPAFCKDYFPRIQDLDFSFCLCSSCLSPQDANIFQGTLLELSRLYFSKSQGFEFRCISLLNLLFYYIITAVPYNQAEPEEKNRILIRNQRIQRISQYIQEHYTEKLLLTQVAKAEGLTVSYLSHFFKEHFHLSFQEYLSSIRCEKARQLLLLTEHGLLDICLECGFSDIKYMNKAFLKKYGCTPRQYRKEILKAPLPVQQKTILSTQNFFSDTTSLVLLEQYFLNAEKILKECSLGKVL